MSLFLDVSITAQSIVDAAWARATANRERLRRRLDVQAVREDAARSSKDNFWETVYTTPTPLLYRPDEPVAHPRPPTATPGFSIAWVSEELEDYIVRPDTANSFYYRVKIASGNGQAVVEHEFDYANPSAVDLTPNNSQLFSGAPGAATFPAPGGLLVIGFIYELRDVLRRTPAPGPTDFVGLEFVRVVSTRAWLVTQSSVTTVSTEGFNLANWQTLAWDARKKDSFGNDKDPDWNEFPEQGNVLPTPDTINDVLIGGALQTASPQNYLINDAYASGSYADATAFLARIEELRALDLDGETFPDDVPVTLDTSTAVPSAEPLESGWASVIGYDFGETAYVASKYAAIQ